ncbi:hypothetical protein ACI78Q_06015 [Geodermatophilus sp. SYSU D00705]
MSAPTITSELLGAALALHAAGLCVLPAAEDGSKRPAVDWKRYQAERPTEAELRAWFTGARTGLGVVAGAVSGGIELTEIEGRAVEAGALDRLRDAVDAAGERELWDRLVNGYVVKSPAGGIHIVARNADGTTPGNTKLAATTDHVTLAETRGEGGWFVTAPSHGNVHPTKRPWALISGGPDTIPTVTADERERFHALIRTLDERPAPEPQAPAVFAPLSRGAAASVSPGDDYSRQTTWDEVLTPDGWRRAFTSGEVTFWTRPGKARGISATTGYGGDWLYVFTSSTVLTPERTYDRFGYHAAWHHGGDFSQAARALAAQGYGKRSEASPTTAQPLLGPTVTPCNLDQAHAVFRRWLGDVYDLQALDVALAAAAVEQLDGDPVWLLVVSGPGNAKTETVAALAGIGAHVTSTITSEGALLSATSKKERGTDATGGLLRKIGDHGLLVIKDVTSILSMNRDSRAAVLAALREVYDGRWERNVGTDGGRTLTWTGRLSLIGAVTTAWDAAHAVISAMGDRFALVRMDSGASSGRLAAGRQALRNVGREEQMRPELAEAAGGVLAQLQPAAARLTEDDEDQLLALADLVTLARTAVDRDSRGEIIDAHAPEMPTRFAKMLGQIVRGGLALGLHHQQALALARRVAGDSMPPLRLAILADLLVYPMARVTDVHKRLQKPRSTVDRALQELHLLGLVEQHEAAGRGWPYELSKAVDQPTLRALITRNVSTPGVRVDKKGDRSSLPVDIPGDVVPPVPASIRGETVATVQLATVPTLPAGLCDVCGKALDPFAGDDGRCRSCTELTAVGIVSGSPGQQACGHPLNVRAKNGKCAVCLAAQHSCESPGDGGRTEVAS